MRATYNDCSQVVVTAKIINIKYGLLLLTDISLDNELANCTMTRTAAIHFLQRLKKKGGSSSLFLVWYLIVVLVIIDFCATAYNKYPAIRERKFFYNLIHHLLRKYKGNEV